MSTITKLGLIAGGAVCVVVGIKALVSRYGLMKKMMFTVRKSRLDFDETVKAIKESAIESGWEVPNEFDIQQQYIEAGHEDMTRMRIIYLCYPHGGYRILNDDADKSMSVIMPGGVSVYEAADGQVCIAAINYELMKGMFSGTVKEVLQEAATMYANTLHGIAEETETRQNLSQLPAQMMTQMMAWMMGHMPDE